MILGSWNHQGEGEETFTSWKCGFKAFWEVGCFLTSSWREFCVQLIRFVRCISCILISSLSKLIIHILCAWGWSAYYVNVVSQMKLQSVWLQLYYVLIVDKSSFKLSITSSFLTTFLVFFSLEYLLLAVVEK